MGLTAPPVAPTHPTRADGPASPTRPRLLGPHAAVRGGLLPAVERAEALGASAIQVFTDDPRAWAPRADPHPDAERFREALAERGIVLLVHASYLVNLASPDLALRERGVERMAHELVAAARLGARAVTVHVGSHRGAGVAAGVERVAESVAGILALADALIPVVAEAPRLVLEVSAGQGDALGVTIEEMGWIVEAAARRGVDRGRLGVCLDTAHLWGAGYALDEPAAIDDLLASLDAIGPDAFALVHLNDSRVGRGSRQDRHEHIGMGRIGEAGLGHLVRHPRLVDVPLILETPDLDAGWDALDMARVRSLGAGPRQVRVVRADGAGGAHAHMHGSPPEHA